MGFQPTLGLGWKSFSGGEYPKRLKILSQFTPSLLPLCIIWPIIACI